MHINNKSSHILNTSATLFGFCFVVLSSLKRFRISERTHMDQVAMISMFLFLTSCTFSFLSLRSLSDRSQKYEKIADYIFLSGLFSLFFDTFFIGFNIIQ